MTKKIRSTTIIGVRHKGGVAMAGDGQVTLTELCATLKKFGMTPADARIIMKEFDKDGSNTLEKLSLIHI